jgi:hypothetical protein
MEYSKLCPKCGRKQVYTEKYTRNNALKRNVWCNSCRGNERKVKVPDNGWIKLCPKCGRSQKYSCKSVYTVSVKKNKVCINCAKKIDIPLEGYIRVCKKCGAQQKYSCRRSYLISKKQNTICKTCATKESAKYIDKSFMKSDEYRNIMSKSLKSSKIHKKKMSSKEVREKLRVAKLKQIKELGTQTNYNAEACEFINKLNKERNWNLQHALNGGEIRIGGYSLDGYDKEKNIIFEYDERKHEIKTIKEKDKVREQIIIQKINPKIFIRYSEKNNRLYDVISDKEII